MDKMVQMNCRIPASLRAHLFEFAARNGVSAWSCVRHAISEYIQRKHPRSSSRRGVFEKPSGSGVWWITYYDTEGKRHRKKIGDRLAAEKARAGLPKGKKGAALHP
jgi:hypothetical protein